MSSSSICKGWLSHLPGCNSSWGKDRPPSYDLMFSSHSANSFIIVLPCAILLVVVKIKNITPNCTGCRRHSSGVHQEDCSASALPSAQSWEEGQAPEASNSVCEHPVCAGVLPQAGRVQLRQVSPGDVASPQSQGGSFWELVSPKE